jgi:hypothetical protein
MSLEHIYEVACATQSDIHEHLPKLRELASQCEHVTEFGLRNADGSTIALLAGLAHSKAKHRTLVSWDLDPRALISTNAMHLRSMADEAGVRWQLRCGDTREIIIESTDLLFIDTYHTFAQLRAELERHASVARDLANGNKSVVRRWLAFHDTETFGYLGEDGTDPGLVMAIRHFQKTNFPRWQLLYDNRNCNGLSVLRRVTPGAPHVMTEIIPARGK